MKTLRSILLIVAVMTTALSASPRELIRKSFVLEPMDLTASTSMRLDGNGDPCALVKVSLPVEGCKFYGDIVDPVNFHTTEYWVYLTDVARRLEIRCPGFETLFVDLITDDGEQGVRPRATYRLKLSGYDNYGPASNVDPGANFLILDIEPSNATALSVKVDGQTQSVEDGKTMTYLKYGQHSYTVDAKGYASVEGSAVVGRDGNTTVKVRLESVMSTLTVRSETEDATIKINGQTRGTGSWSGQLTPGMYQVEVSKEGYRPHSETVELRQHDAKTMTIAALTPVYGALTVSYKPIGADIKIDGRSVGTTPAVLREVTVGRHSVSVSKAGYESLTTSVDIKEGQTAMLDGSLTLLRTTNNSATNSAAPTISTATTSTHNGHEYVDLGLPSGLKWATCNVGASSPSNYGYSFAWGETTTKSKYTEKNSKTFKKSVSDISGNTEYDAARANWDGSWRLPTKAEMEELKSKCKWTWTTQGGYNGYKVTGPNGRSIFLPAAGSRFGSSLNRAGEYGRYWSSTPYEGSTQSAYSLNFGSGVYTVYRGIRNFGHTVRPVLSASESAKEPEYITVRGRVTESEGVLIGATVMLSSDRRNATITDIDGNFIIRIPSAGSPKLLITYIGKRTVTIDVDTVNNPFVDVKMEEDPLRGF